MKRLADKFLGGTQGEPQHSISGGTQRETQHSISEGETQHSISGGTQGETRHSISAIFVHGALNTVSQPSLFMVRFPQNV